MRRRVEFAVLAILTAAIVVLVLNHLEVDDYPAGIDPSEPTDLPTWISQTLVHYCDVCKECLHRFEVAQCELRVVVRDQDRWYRLFWAEDDFYVYDDAALVGGSLRNRTAHLAGGTWIIRGRYRPEHRHPAHECSAAADLINIRYHLMRGVFPGPGDPELDPSGTVAVPGKILWFRYPYPPDRLDDFWWELESAPFLPIPSPCYCQ